MCKFAKVATLMGLLSVVLNSSIATAAKAGPCHPIIKRCKKAGYRQGGHAHGKGLYHDCVTKITSGQSVKGVTASAKEIAACKKHADAHGSKN